MSESMVERNPDPPSIKR